MLKVETFVMLILSHYTTLSPSIRGVIGVNTLTTLKRLETGFEEEVKTAAETNVTHHLTKHLHSLRLSISMVAQLPTQYFSNSYAIFSL